ncbi:MAG: hypothetical protein Fur006_30880 [Coleofasciculaceae cyanobacterium]
MKVKSFAQLLTGLAIALCTTMAISQPNNAQQRTYQCVVIQGVPTTIARTQRGILPMIRWVSAYLPRGLTPQQRCEQASERFQAHRDNGTLKYITTGTIGGKPVVCVAARRGGDCTDVLFELNSKSDAKRALKKLLNQRGLGAGNPLNEGGSTRIYIDVEDYLNRVTPE